jgi:hypothetical protein
MSFGYASTRQSTIKTLPTDPVYVRPSEWIALTPVGATEQKFTGLFAVYPDDTRNIVAVFAAISGGSTYTVDWGDGTVENVTGGTQRDHQYTYASVGNLTSYGYKQVIITITPTSGANNLLQLNINLRPAAVTSATWPAAWLDIEFGSPNLTLATIGKNATAVNLGSLQRIRFVSKNASYTSFLDFFYYCYGLQQIIMDCDTSTVTNFGSMFNSCYSLIYGPPMNTSAATNTGGMFQNCYNLLSVPLYSFSNVTTSNLVFSNCYRLTNTQITSLAKATDTSSMFNGCANLVSINNLSLPNVTTINSMFQNCRSLTSLTISNISSCNIWVGAFQNCSHLSIVNISGNMASVVNANMSSTFTGCSSLTQITFPETSKVLTFTNMFQGCSQLANSPITNTSNANTMATMYQACSALSNVANTDTSKVTNFNSTFNACQLLPSALNYNTSNATNVSGMYQACGLITTLPAYNLSNIGSGNGGIISSGAGTSSTPLVSSNVTGLKYTVTYGSCNMNAASLTNVMNNLAPVGAAAQTITITGNPGADTAVSTRTATWVSNDNKLTMANTVGITVGQQVTNAVNMNTGYSMSAYANSRISTTSAITDNTMISFSAVTTTNLSANTYYYTSNGSGTSPTFYFDLSTTPGGTPVTFTAGTMTGRVNLLVTAVSTNANITLNAYPAGSNAVATAVTTRILNTNLASYKGWTVTG